VNYYFVFYAAQFGCAVVFNTASQRGGM